jgi:putative DNA primase/helicase
MKNHKMTLNFIGCRQDKILEQQEVTWDELLNLLAGKFLRKGQMTLAECQTALEEKRKADKDGPAWIPGSVHDISAGRSQANMDKIFLLVLDLDEGMPLAEVKARISGYEAAIHSTFSHTREMPKFRVVIPLKEPIQAQKILKVFDHFQGRFDGLLDPSCGHDYSRLFYLPACPVDAEHLFVFEHLEGEFLDVAALLNKPIVVAPRILATPDNTKPPASLSLGIYEGVRNVKLTSIGGSLRRRGMTEPDIRTELLKVNSDRCMPPMADREVDGIAKSVARYSVPENCIRKTLNDAGNAHRLVSRHGTNIRFIRASGKWLLWRNEKWEVDQTGQIIEIAKETAISIYDEANTKNMEREMQFALDKHAGQSLNRNRLRNMVDLASSDPDVAVLQGGLDHDDMLLGVQNGVVDLRTGEFRPTVREDLITIRSGASYDESARCPLFEAFLRRVMGGDEEMALFMQRLVGYSLTGRTNEHSFAFLYGVGSNGKSTFLDVLMRLLGDYAAQAQPETFMARRSGGSATGDLARLVGKRVVVSNEVREGGCLEENLVKQLVGGDVVTARHLYGSDFEFHPKLKLFIAGNHQPVIKGDDMGIWRRVMLIPFTQTIPEPERDKQLGFKLVAELSGILNWAITGCLAWQREELKPPAAIVKATKRYREEMDLFQHWIDEECCPETGVVVSSKSLYDNYRKWCEEGAIKPLANPTWCRKMESRGFARMHKKTGNVFVGLDFKSRGSPALALVA